MKFLWCADTVSLYSFHWEIKYHLGKLPVFYIDRLYQYLICCSSSIPMCYYYMEIYHVNNDHRLSSIEKVCFSDEVHNHHTVGELFHIKPTSLFKIASIPP